MSEAEKRRRLRRSRLIATALLPLMGALLWVGGVLKAAHPEFAYVQFFAEASLIGGLADWFAVVALFRHPLGIGLPHTAIIPRNKDRIGRELGRFIDENFLTAATVGPWLARQDVAGQVLRWASQPANMRALLALFSEAMPAFARATADTIAVILAGRAGAERLARIDLASLLGSALRASVAAGLDDPALSSALAAVAGWLDQNRTLVTSRFGEHSPLTSRFFDSFVVNRFIDGIIDLVHEIIGDPAHEMRGQFSAKLTQLADRLETDQTVRQHVTEIQLRFLARIDVAALVKDVCAIAADGAAMLDRQRAAQVAARILRAAAMDESAVERINDGLSRAVASALGAARLRALIEDIIHAWDTRLIVEKLELEVGHDLQFIRLNGMAVGGLVGLVLHPLLIVAGID